MNLNQLEYFIAVVNEGNISSAAKSLHMSQPPLSNHMKLLENEIGCMLFERGARNIRLTEAGTILYNKSIVIVDLFNSTLQEIESYKKGISGTLRIGVVSSTGTIFLKNWLLPFQKMHPYIHYEILEANTYELFEQLKSNRLDFALIRTPFPITSYKCINLLEESLVAVGHNGFFQKNKALDKVTLEELSNVPILIYRRWESILMNLLEEKQIKWDIFCKSDDARTTLLWANEGLGIGIVPESAICFADCERTIVKSLSNATLRSTISLMYDSNTYQSSTVKLFLEFLNAT